MQINDLRGRGIRIPFGKNVRGLRIETLELEHDDIIRMLEMNERSIKDALLMIIHGMEIEHRSRPSIRNYENHEHSDLVWSED